jgi:hypothetical protein
MYVNDGVRYKKHTYFQLVLARNGSPLHVSIAQNGIGSRIQLRPADAMAAISCSVYDMI